MKEQRVQTFYLDFLRGEFDRRRAENSSYSVRAFALKLGISPASLSQILRGISPLSLKMAEKVVVSLRLTPLEKREFLKSVAKNQNKRDLKRVDPRVKDVCKGRYTPARNLEIELYKQISSWYHAAILELTYREDFISSPLWIAKELGITTSEAKIAVERLLALELLEVVDGKLQKVDSHLDTKDRELTNSALKTKQKEIRLKAIDAIENQPVESRSMTTYTMCIDPKLIPQAKANIQKFQQEMGELLESGARKEVYVMEIGLFSLEDKN